MTKRERVYIHSLMETTPERTELGSTDSSVEIKRKEAQKEELIQLIAYTTYFYMAKTKEVLESMLKRYTKYL